MMDIYKQINNLLDEFHYFEDDAVVHIENIDLAIIGYMGASGNE